MITFIILNKYRVHSAQWHRECTLTPLAMDRFKPNFICSLYGMGERVYSCSFGHMTKMTATPRFWWVLIYKHGVKNAHTPVDKKTLKIRSRPTTANPVIIKSRTSHKYVQRSSMRRYHTYPPYTYLHCTL